jgi:cellulose synthase/poly-beta-1,6-N-acetylglucosamine synthase-like glycosyltransferase
VFEIIFFINIGVLAYIYLGYGILLYILSIFIRKPVNKHKITPNITIIIAAYNEETSIASKIENALALEYPEEKLEIIVGSDASNDDTDKVIKTYSDRGVRLIRVEGRLGKTAVQNECVKHASGEIIIFTDATTLLYPDSVVNMVSNFYDNEVGCVGARLVYTNRGQTQVGHGGTSYWNYETSIKQLESQINSLIGVSGCFYAIRKSLYTTIPNHLISDFVVALKTVKNGYRVIFENTAICEEETLAGIPDEIHMRIRVALRTYTALYEYKEMLNPFKYGLFSVQLISHKILRYGAGIFLAGAFISNIILLDTNLYRFTFALQLLFYSSALFGHLRYLTSNKRGILSIPYYFVLVNYAATIALIRFCKGDKVVTWETKR